VCERRHGTQLTDTHHRDSGHHRNRCRRPPCRRAQHRHEHGYCFWQAVQTGEKDAQRQANRRPTGGEHYDRSFAVRHYRPSRSQNASENSHSESPRRSSCRDNRRRRARPARPSSRRQITPRAAHQRSRWGPIFRGYGRQQMPLGTPHPYSVNRWRWTRPLLSQTSNRYAVPRVSENVGVFGTVALNC
jgi:hypothetical protein